MRYPVPIYRFSTSIYDNKTKRTKQYVRRVKVIQLAENEYRLLCIKYEFDTPTAIALVRKVAYLFDEIILELDKDKNIVRIKNVPSIQKRWEKTKQILLKDHSGKAVQNYFNIVNSTIYNNQRLYKFLESDKMYGLFFKSLRLLKNNKSIKHMEVSKSEDKLILQELNDSNKKKYIYENHLLKECYEINDNIRHEILLLGY